MVFFSIFSYKIIIIWWFIIKIAIILYLSPITPKHLNFPYKIIDYFHKNKLAQIGELASNK